MKDKVLGLLLEEEDYISGQAIGEKLGISRTAVWKNMNKLKSEGYEIESVSNRGYKLVNKPDKINKEELKYLLKESNLVDEILVFDSIDSTNKEAKKQGVNGVSSALIVSEEQTLGKGRRGRTWVSDKGSGIYMSILLRPDIRPENASLLTLIAGYAVQQAIKELTMLTPMIKWPNDLVVNKKKVCGILTEMSSEIDFVNYVIVGIGVNVKQQPFDEDLIDKATSLENELQSSDAATSISRQQLIGKIVTCFEKVYTRFIEENSLGFMIDDYNKACINIEQMVRVIYNREEIIGKCLSVKANGSIVIRREDNKEEIDISSGEVSVRGLYGYV